MSWAEVLKAESFAQKTIDENAQKIKEHLANSIDENFFLSVPQFLSEDNIIAGDNFEKVKFTLGGNVLVYSNIYSSYLSTTNRFARVLIYKNGQLFASSKIDIENGEYNKTNKTTVSVKRGDVIEVVTTASHSHVTADVTLRGQIQKKGGVLKNVE